MRVSAPEVGSAARAQATAVVCDTSDFNLRFLHAAMTKLGYRQVIEVHTIEELVRKATVGQVELVVFDPAMQDGAGLDAIKDLRAAVPDALLVAFCSDDAMTRSVKWQGIITVQAQHPATGCADRRDPVRARARRDRGARSHSRLGRRRSGVGPGAVARRPDLITRGLRPDAIGH